MNKEILDLGSRNPVIDEMNSAFGINNDIEKKRNLLEEEITKLREKVSRLRGLLMQSKSQVNHIEEIRHDKNDL